MWSAAAARPVRSDVAPGPAPGAARGSARACAMPARRGRRVRECRLSCPDESETASSSRTALLGNHMCTLGIPYSVYRYITRLALFAKISVGVRYPIRNSTRAASVTREIAESRFAGGAPPSAVAAAPRRTAFKTLNVCWGVFLTSMSDSACGASNANTVAIDPAEAVTPHVRGLHAAAVQRAPVRALESTDARHAISTLN